MNKLLVAQYELNNVLAGERAPTNARMSACYLDSKMKTLITFLSLAIGLTSQSVSAAEPAADKKPYSLIVWADVSFDDKSQVSQIQIQQKETLPAAFANYLMTAMATGPFTKPENAEANKQLETGLKVIVEIDPATSKVKILSQDLMPRPTRVEQQSEPRIRVKGDWSGRVLVTCAISDKGRCAKPKIDPTTNAPAEIPKVLMATIGTWRFVPQKRAGKAVEGEFTTWINIESDTSMPPEKFGKSI